MRRAPVCAAAAAIARTELLPLIRAIPGVSAADLTGGTTKRLVITLDPTAMAKAGVSVERVQGILQANQLTVPAGSLTSLAEPAYRPTLPGTLAPRSRLRARAWPAHVPRGGQHPDRRREEGGGAQPAIDPHRDHRQRHRQPLQ